MTTPKEAAGLVEELRLYGTGTRVRQAADMLETLNAQVEELRRERDDWKKVCRSAGVCMTCALGAPDTFGCTDCLNTGWDGGSPAGFIHENRSKELIAAAEARATKAEAGIAEAVKALEPFKRIADMEEHAEDSASVIINVNLCRAARAFVEKHKESAA